jgi:hypothetical protein
MDDDHNPSNPSALTPDAQTLYRRTLESVGEGQLAEKEGLTPTEAYRLLGKLTRSIVEGKRVYNLALSDRDIDALRDLKSADYARIQKEWHKRHFESALSVWQLLAWGAAAVASWYLLFRPAIVNAWGPPQSAVPLFVLRIVGGIIGLFVVIMTPLALSVLFASENRGRLTASH